MKPTLQQIAHLLEGGDAKILGCVAGAFILGAPLAWLYARSHRPSDEEVERRRCELLAETGRITDGVILDAHTLSGDNSTSTAPEVLVYSYRIAGVTYNCAQDISRLHERVPVLRPGESIVDQSVQVRYDPHDPGNSILVAETWTGLWKREG